MGERERNAHDVRTPPSKCLLWVSAGCDVPLELLDGLRRRDVAVRQVHDAPSVMAALAGEGAKVLVLVEPSTLRSLERLIGAVRSYFDVSIWRYQRGAAPALAPYDAGPMEHAAEPPEVPESPTPSPKPHAADTEHHDDAGDDSDLGDIGDSGVLLSEAELAMLLHDDDEDLKEAEGS